MGVPVNALELLLTNVASLLLGVVLGGAWALRVRAWFQQRLGGRG